MIHADASFLIRSLIRETLQERLLRRWLGAGERLAVSTVAWTEFLCGPFRDDLEVLNAEELWPERVPYLPEHALLAAELFNQAGRRRGSLNDCMIAACAIMARAPLATANEADFRRFVGRGLVLAGPPEPS